MNTKNILKNIMVFLLTLFICMGLLLVVCQIPQSSIEKNSRISAEYFKENEGFPLVIGDMVNSRADNYADCVLFNVIYNVDADRSFYSMIAAPYYYVEGNDAQDSYYATVFEGQDSNAEYSRYWHGSQVLIRLLLLFTSITGIRMILFAVLICLNLWLAFLLLKQKQYIPAGIYFLSLLGVQFWMTAFSLEYIMSFLVMTAVCIGVVLLQGRDLTRLFIVSGMVTCFLDFLTAETLTFTVPVILCFMLRKTADSLEGLKEEILRLLRWGCGWLCSYALMFAVKWGLVYAVVGQSAFSNALENAALRIEGDVAVDSSGIALSAGEKLSSLLLRNLACLFPVGTDVSTALVLGLVFGILVAGFVVLYLFRGKSVDGTFIFLMLGMALIPYIRFLCLSNHSFIHYFFTYRAQMAALMALMAVVAFNLQPSYIMKNKKSRTDKKKKRR